MINFIICEDNRVILQKNIDIINRAMFNNNINYRIYSFTEYNNDLKKVIKNKDTKKIYILDIELGNTSGLEISREIRKYDIDSFIIISTAHTEYLPYTLKSKLLIYDFISKFDDYDSNLFKAINNILEVYPEYKTLSIKIKGKNHSIHFNEIISIKYDSNKRKTIITTKNKVYEANAPIVSITRDLDSRFIKTKDKTIVNTRLLDNKKSIPV